MVDGGGEEPGEPPPLESNCNISSESEDAALEDKPARRRGRKKKGREARKRKGKERHRKRKEDARREELVQYKLIKLLGESPGGAEWLASGREASAVLADLAKRPGGPEWLKAARVRAEDWVDDRTRCGIPLARFTEEENAEWDAKEEMLYVGSGISDTRDFHVDVDFIH